MKNQKVHRNILLQKLIIPTNSLDKINKNSKKREVLAQIKYVINLFSKYKYLSLKYFYNKDDIIRQNIFRINIYYDMVSSGFLCIATSNNPAYRYTVVENLGVFINESFQFI